MKLERCPSVDTAIFGRVTVTEMFDTESEARAAGYYFDGHAFLVNGFGGVEVPPFRVLKRDNGENDEEYCVVL